MSAISENDVVSPVGNGETFLANNEFTDEDDIDEDLKEACEILLSKKPPTEKDQDFTVEGNLQRFVADWREDFNETVGKDGNILHRLILKGEEGDIDRLDHLKEAITLIVADHPHLLWQDQMEKENQTPLWLAIKKKEASMVMAFMDGLKKSEKSSPQGIQGALRQPVDPQRRCILHWAIDENLSDEAIEALLVYVTDDILLTQDINGRTPLHSAVTYGDCTAGRVGVIRHMLRHANHALSVVDASKHSIYAHHLRTRKLWLDKAAKDAAKAAAKESTKAQQSREQSKDQTAPDSKSEMRTATTRAPLGRDVDPKRADKSQQSAPFKQLDTKSESSELSHDSQKEGRYDGSKRGQDARDSDSNQIAYRDTRTSNQQEGSVNGDPCGLGPGRASRINQGSRREPPLDPTPGINRTFSAKGEDQADQWIRRRGEEVEEGQRGTEQKPPGGSSRRRRRRDDEAMARAAQEKRKRRDAMEKMNAREQAKRRPEILKQNSETVMLEIKLRCMRTLSPRETAKILYGNNPEDRQICFDFPGRSSVHLETFKMSFKTVQFDEVLQYVAFPTVRFEEKNSDEVASARDGRKEMIKIFDWLRQNKGVKRIIKIIVNDFDKPAHSDRAILDSLRGLHVEELQWLKTDLDPVTILKVSDDIRKLRLRWSGSNTALRAWSDPYGLRKLQHLDTVQLELVGTEVLESYEDTQVNIKRFEERLNVPHSTETDENKLSAGDRIQPRRVVVKSPVMNIFARSTTSHVVSDTDMKHTHIENHKWVNTMDNFREEMGPVWKEAEKQARRDSSKAWLAEPIVVALIDDGVDVLEPSLQGKLFEGKTLSYDLPDGNEPTDQREHAFWESSGGHGTVMASMIFRICPMAKLYVIRMETHFDSVNRGRIVARSAAEAVNAAVDKGVNIISMSWTIAQNEQSEASGLRNAIERARDKNILMFASSSDRGYYNDNSWPVAINRDAFFHIGAAKADGKPFDWAGPVDRLNYTFPGVDVIKAQNKSLPPSDSRYQQRLERMETETGSSVATALAAGTAAMLLTCARIAAIESSDSSRGVTRNVLREMQKRDNMATALDRLGISLGENKFIEVWKTLNTQEWPGFSEQRPEGKMKMVADKITSFLPTPLVGK